MSPSSKRRGARSQPEPQPAGDDESLEEVDEEDLDGEEYEYEPPGRRYERIGAGAGVAYAVVGFIGSSLLPIGRVDPHDSATTIARELVADRGRVSAGILLTMLSLFFLMVFLAWLRGWLRDVEGEGGWLTTLAVIGGSVLVAMLLVVVLLSIGATVLDDYGPDPVIARTILVLQWQAVAVTFIPAAAFVGGVGLVGATTGAMPRWLSVSGVVIAVGLLIPPLAFLPFLLSTLWTGMLAAFLLQRSRFGF